jgi:hypothetical protein
MRGTAYTDSTPSNTITMTNSTSVKPRMRLPRDAGIDSNAKSKEAGGGMYRLHLLCF